MSSPLRRLLAATRSRIAQKIRSLSGDEFLPLERFDDDLFLVEFPKSGITWLTFLIANTNAILNEDKRKVTFFNINDFVPDVQSVRSIRPSTVLLPGYRCFKSHSPYIARYRKVIYLVRDPRHVMTSYWVFLKGLRQWQGSLGQLVRDRRYGIKAWIDHVTGWMNGIDPAAAFVVVRYEDLVANASAELKRLYSLLGVPVEDGLISRAVERSNLDSMRQLELEFTVRHPALLGTEFVRRKKIGGERARIDQDVRSLIEAEAGSVMEWFGYRLDSVELGPVKLPMR